MWGSTEPNTASKCNWRTTPFNNGSRDYDETYFNSVKDTVCPNGILAKEYDAATQIMGGDWRMPTQTELKELRDNTTSVWVKDYNGSGVNGRKFTSKTNGNSIFIPASGERIDSSFNYRTSKGNVWSSSLNGLIYQALSLTVYSDSVYANNNRYRSYGLVVRGVL